LKTVRCGICATDLSRKFLPFPLPQVIGHEVVAKDPDSGEHFVVEINDTYAARGDAMQDMFCAMGLPTHSPDRMVLGIDRLPGGFGPYILAPVNGIVPIKTVDVGVAALIEPFAATLHAVTSSPPRPGDRVAVLGPGRLGLLLIAALHAYRRSHGTGFSIAALSTHEYLLDLSQKLGAGHVVNLNESRIDSLKNSFDLLYDTTGSPSGFESALTLARREIHLKSTHGLPVQGLAHMTELVGMIYWAIFG
jgi:Zn-dependent alcohol dehydrogenases